MEAQRQDEDETAQRRRKFALERLIDGIELGVTAGSVIPIWTYCSSHHTVGRLSLGIAQGIASGDRRAAGIHP